MRSSEEEEGEGDVGTWIQLDCGLVVSSGSLAVKEQGSSGSCTRGCEAARGLLRLHGVFRSLLVRVVGSKDSRKFSAGVAAPAFARALKPWDVGRVGVVLRSREL